MLIARLQSPAFHAERTALAKYLTHTKARFSTRVLRAAQDRGTSPGNAHRLLAEFCDLAFEAIRTDFYRPLHIWCRMHADDAHDSAGELALVRTACDTLESECEAALPVFAPLLGDIRFALGRIRRAIAARCVEVSRAFDHDAVDVALDDALMSLDARSLELGLHARIVADWAERIATRLYDSADIVLHVQRGAMLADIGKLTTPRHILDSNRPRSIAENIVFEQHAHAGWEIVSHIPELREFAPGVLAHHERLDGTGYPDGLRADEIPAVARIIAVADEFADALGAHSAQSNPWVSAAAQLIALDGGRYDEGVLHALRAIVSDGDREKTTEQTEGRRL